jgi:chromosome segregation ATPase
LQNLQNRVAALDGEILTRLGQLHSLERELAAAEARTDASDRELAALQQEVREQKALAEQSFERAMALESERNAIESDIESAQRNQAADETKIETLKQEVTRLEGDVVVLNRAIERNLNLKAEKYLSNSGSR